MRVNGKPVTSELVALIELQNTMEAALHNREDDERPGDLWVYSQVIEESPVVRKPDPEAETFPGAGKILLIDDEEYVRELAKKILERAGSSVITAVNGKEAQRIPGREQSIIARIVIDLIIPQMDGKQCLEELRNVNPQAKVIVSTGHTLDARESLHVGSMARGFVNKKPMR
jgi:CheY-like chemotaxis protein